MAYSIFRHRSAIALLSLFSLQAYAQTIQANLWNMPKGKGTDLQQSFTAGDVLPISWNKLATTPYLDTTNNLVDLWVTAWPPTETLPAFVAEFNQLLKCKCLPSGVLNESSYTDTPSLVCSKHQFDCFWRNLCLDHRDSSRRLSRNTRICPAFQRSEPDLRPKC